MEPVEHVVARLLKSLKGTVVSYEEVFELAPDASSNPAYFDRILSALSVEGVEIDESNAKGKESPGATSKKPVNGRAVNGRAVNGRAAKGRAAKGRATKGRAANGRTVTPNAVNGRTAKTAAADGNITDEERAVAKKEKEDEAAAIRKLDDPIRMYFSQMAEIPLLAREDEVSLAKDIESSRNALRSLLYSTRYGQEQVVDLFELLLSKQLLIEKALDVNLSRKGERHEFFIELEKSVGTLKKNLKANIVDFEDLSSLDAGLSFCNQPASAPQAVPAKKSAAAKPASKTTGARNSKSKNGVTKSNAAPSADVAKIQKRLVGRIRRSVSLIEKYHIKISYLARWKSNLERFGRLVRSVIPSPRQRRKLVPSPALKKPNAALFEHYESFLRRVAGIRPSSPATSAPRVASPRATSVWSSASRNGIASADSPSSTSSRKATLDSCARPRNSSTARATSSRPTPPGGSARQSPGRSRRSLA